MSNEGIRPDKENLKDALQRAADTIRRTVLRSTEASDSLKVAFLNALESAVNEQDKTADEAYVRQVGGAIAFLGMKTVMKLPEFTDADSIEEMYRAFGFGLHDISGGAWEAAMEVAKEKN